MKKKSSYAHLIAIVGFFVAAIAFFLAKETVLTGAFATLGIANVAIFVSAKKKAQLDEK